MPDLEIFENNADLVEAVADRFLQIGNQAVQTNGKFSTALAGGSTPLAVYQLLAESQAAKLDWLKVHFFWGDERCVPPDHPESNFGMAYDALLKHIRIPETNIQRMEGELDPNLAADNYEKMLRSTFEDSPSLDLILLGMGIDGHTASLFPGTDAVNEKRRWVTAAFIPKLDTWRITLTPAILNQAKRIIFMVSGSSKASVLKKVLLGEYQPQKYPAQIIQPEIGKVTWMIDEAASKKLK